MRNSPTAFAFAALLAFSPLAARADIIYTYTGNSFTTASAPYSTSNSITGSLTFANPLGANLSDADVTGQVLGYSFSDGILTLDSSNGGLVTFQASTDSQGAIDNWIVFVVGNFNSLRTCNGGTGIFGCVAPVDYSEMGTPETASGSNASDPGTWSAAMVSSTPEPSTFGLALGALLLAGLTGLRTRSA